MTSCGGRRAEVVYFFAVWWYIIWQVEPGAGLPDTYYWAAIVVHVVATLVFAGLRGARHPAA